MLTLQYVCLKPTLQFVCVKPTCMCVKPILQYMYVCVKPTIQYVCEAYITIGSYSDMLF